MTSRAKGKDQGRGTAADSATRGPAAMPIESGHTVSNIERLLCGPAAEGMLDRLQVRGADAWQMRLPGLDQVIADEVGCAAPAARPRICIATEQITGPVRNGGIGSTYANLALLLARCGFDVTVLYLRGEQVETATIGYWVTHYAALGVTLVPAPDYARAERFASNADRWLRVPYNMMRWLMDNPMDVVHVSEWRGTGYLCLLAKRQGWAFAETLFVVKTSSPWLWNRLYGGHMLDRADDLVKIHAERRSVELGDVVIGGSLHLLRWMTSQGYGLPAGRTFVQPNVVTFTTLEPLMRARTLTPGARVPIDEFVFFGRLEVRKGLFIFCQAIRRLVRKGVPLPQRITFMGKPGGRLPSHPDLDTPDYIREVSENWPCEVRILTGFQQVEAIEYLLGGNRLAVMPSIIENSSMAIYEAAICAIPTVATDVGGNAELIDARDHAAVLCQPHPVALSDKLHEALTLGGMVPRPSFSNDANLATWVAFHEQLGGPLRRRLLDQCRAQDSAPAAPASAVCIYFLGHAAALDATLASLAAQELPPHEVFVGVDADSDADCDAAAGALARHGFAPRVVECFDLDAGGAFNRMADAARGDFVLFLWEGAQLVPQALRALQTIAHTTGAAVLNYLVEARELGADEAPELSGQFIVGVGDALFRDDAREVPLFVRRSAFAQIGGFTADYRLLGHEQELLARAQLAGLVCETVPMHLGSVVAQPAEWLRARGYDLSATAFRTLRPQLAAAPLALRDAMLLARGMAARGGAKHKPDSTANPESVLMRILAGLNKDALTPPERGPTPSPVRPPVQSPAIGGYLALFDMVDGDRLPAPAKLPRQPRARARRRPAAC
jgi:glycosyltransferase involved in cell wall biosynthesis